MAKQVTRTAFPLLKRNVSVLNRNDGGLWWTLMTFACKLVVSTVLQVIVPGPDTFGQTIDHFIVKFVVDVFVESAFRTLDT